MPALGQKRKSKEERREIVKKAIRIQRGLDRDSTIKELAEEHSIHRNVVYEYLRFAKDDPVGRLEEAEEEVEFRIEVLELLGYEFPDE